MPDANKTIGEDVKKPAPDQFDWIERFAFKRSLGPRVINALFATVRPIQRVATLESRKNDAAFAQLGLPLPQQPGGQENYHSPHAEAGKQSAKDENGTDCLAHADLVAEQSSGRPSASVAEPSRSKI
jgi:hypothetical protein